MKTAIKKGTLVVNTTRLAQHHSFGEVGSPKPPSPQQPFLSGHVGNVNHKRQASPSLSVPSPQMPRRSFSATPPPSTSAPAPAPFNLGGQFSPPTTYWRKSPALAAVKHVVDSPSTTRGIRMPSILELKTKVSERLGFYRPHSRTESVDDSTSALSTSPKDLASTSRPAFFNLNTDDIDDNGVIRTKDSTAAKLEIEVIGHVEPQVKPIETQATSAAAASLLKLNAYELERQAMRNAPRHLRLDGGLYFSAKDPDPLAKEFLALRGVGIEHDPETGSPILVNEHARGLEKYKLNSNNVDISTESVRGFVRERDEYYASKCKY